MGKKKEEKGFLVDVDYELERDGDTVVIIVIIKIGRHEVRQRIRVDPNKAQ